MKKSAQAASSSSEHEGSLLFEAPDLVRRSDPASFGCKTVALLRSASVYFNA